MIIGIVIGFCMFIFINGLAQERQLQVIANQKAKIQELEETRSYLFEEEVKKNEELQKKLTVQSISVTIEKNKRVQLDGVKLIDLKESISSKIRKAIIGNDIESVAKNKGLIFSAINNQAYLIEDQIIHVEVKSLTIYSDLEVQVQIKSQVTR
ncbi:MAG TPA: hypothetical protein VLK78_04695, partial [Candidatus Angelobacter sp.]|nr:hypothetical protein [Candidatus Angelobacter sp.]